jgi:hypothetical protein
MTNNTNLLTRKIVSDCSRELGACFDILQDLRARLNAAGSHAFDADVSVAFECLAAHATANVSHPITRSGADIDLNLQIASNNL